MAAELTGRQVNRPAHIVGRKPRLTVEQVLYIREMHQARRRIPSEAELAHQFGVNQSNIRAAATGRTYQWIKEGLDEL